ncbi:MAG: HIT family protein [Candidatus Pacebacteria bacterium]|mgnify:CR=1 FL=1|jgi:histidine triad (HIT) family protein|nr:HIT family protein [bacterium]MDP6527329.1 HIT family protein [Candidatus Paceibacterota bacterium]MDP6659393.1 HIT family protein [Candidatus Paceibacterota bacterium]|tara:strand:+ start:34935 stop:35345 length:411 start_codon:yes stop_codon:yes gene_type:complete
MSKDLFLKIIAGEVPSEKVYEDEHTFAFLDINPNNPGHTLVVPKKYSRNIIDIEEEDWLNLMKTARKLAPIIMKAMGATGVNVYMNNEPSAFQVIFYTHVHIIPRHDDDRLEVWKGRPYKSEEEQKEVADKIRSLL